MLFENLRGARRFGYLRVPGLAFNPVPTRPANSALDHPRPDLTLGRLVDLKSQTVRRLVNTQGRSGNFRRFGRFFGNRCRCRDGRAGRDVRLSRAGRDLRESDGGQFLQFGDEIAALTLGQLGDLRPLTGLVIEHGDVADQNANRTLRQCEQVLAAKHASNGNDLLDADGLRLPVGKRLGRHIAGRVLAQSREQVDFGHLTDSRLLFLRGCITTYQARGLRTGTSNANSKHLKSQIGWSAGVISIPSKWPTSDFAIDVLWRALFDCK